MMVVASSLWFRGGIAAIAVMLSLTTAESRSAQSIQPAGTTVAFAQTMSWFDKAHFAVGRWDGTISIFRTPSPNEFGPVVTQAMALPSGHGVEMVVAVDQTTIASSDTNDAIILWRRKASSIDDPGKGFELSERLSYDASYGTANSGLAMTLSGEKYLISGHENGYVLFWNKMADGTFKLTRAVDAKSISAPANPWGLRNIRGLGAWRDYVLTGSEDGDIVALSVPDGRQLFRTRYNDKAQRGINNISVLGDLLLVANCAVGSSDKNLWLFDLSSGKPILSDSENLVVDLFKSQVFDFDAVLANGPNGPIFFSSTEEGFLWEGDVLGGRLVVTGITKSSPEGGSIIAIAPDGDLVAVATYAIHLFKTK
jgi:WD40 repeat protein